MQVGATAFTELAARMRQRNKKLLAAWMQALGSSCAKDSNFLESLKFKAIRSHTSQIAFFCKV